MSTINLEEDEEGIRLVLAGVAMHAMLTHGSQIPSWEGVAKAAFDISHTMIDEFIKRRKEVPLQDYHPDELTRMDHDDFPF